MVTNLSARLFRFTSQLVLLTAASADERGRLRRPGNEARTGSLLIEVLSVHGSSDSFWRMKAKFRLPLMVVFGVILYIPVAPTEFRLLLGQRAAWPSAGPLPLL